MLRFLALLIFFSENEGTTVPRMADEADPAVCYRLKTSALGGLSPWLLVGLSDHLEALKQE